MHLTYACEQSPLTLKYVSSHLTIVVTHREKPIAGVANQSYVTTVAKKCFRASRIDLELFACGTGSGATFCQRLTPRYRCIKGMDRSSSSILPQHSKTPRHSLGRVVLCDKAGCGDALGAYSRKHREQDDGHCSSRGNNLPRC